MHNLADHILYIASIHKIKIKRMTLQGTLYLIINWLYKKHHINIFELSKLYTHPFSNSEIGPIVYSIFQKYPLNDKEFIQSNGQPFKEFNALNELILMFISQFNYQEFLAEYKQTNNSKLPNNTEIALAFLLN